MYHSITFGSLTNGRIVGKNTWDDWHLIPSNGPVISQSGVSTSFVDIPGKKDGPINMSKYLTGQILYDLRSGSLQFIVDNDHEDWILLRKKITEYLHGKRMKMCLEDDPDYYYEGRFSLNEWNSESWNSTVTINYAVKPYKYHVSTGQKAL